jgi:hypothetical protein
VNEDAALLAVGFDAPDAFQVDDGGARNAQVESARGMRKKRAGSKAALRLEVDCCLRYPAGAVEGHIVVPRFHVIKFVEGDDVHAAPSLTTMRWAAHRAGAGRRKTPGAGVRRGANGRVRGARSNRSALKGFRR